MTSWYLNIWKLKKKQTLWPLFMDGVQLPQGHNHFKEGVYFLLFSSLTFLRPLLHKVKICLSQEQNELLRWNKKHFFLASQLLSFKVTKLTSKNVADTTFKHLSIPSNFICLFIMFSKLKIIISQRKSKIFIAKFSL